MRGALLPPLLLHLLVISPFPGSCDGPCFCQLQGKVDDCACSVDTVDHFNNAKLYPRLASLLQNDYFRFYRVNLHRQCPFWADDSKCALRSCHVQSCPEEQLPFPIKWSQQPVQVNANNNDIQHHRGNPAEKYSRSQSERSGDCNEELGYLNTTISESAQQDFERWKAHDDAREYSFCEPEDESAVEMEYVDLSLNPERYTGYKGHSAHRIWNSIYQENCFKPQRGFGPYLDSSNVGDMCLEKRVFYRAISGLHTSINVHLCAQYYTPGKSDPLGFSKSSLEQSKKNGDANKGSWGMNTSELKKRFDPSHTGGEGPHWLRNLYFLYLLELRALAKAAPYLRREMYYTSEADSGSVREAVEDLLGVATDFPYHFDESTMFNGKGQEVWEMREEFKMHFRNVSRIMDCVGCEKCKLWGKLQVQGLGTALKILFSPDLGGDQSLPNRFQLRRNEIVALFNSIARLSTSIYELERFRQQIW